MTEDETRYIGDGVYASFDGYHVILTADRRDGKHVIYLDPQVLRSLCALHCELNPVEYRDGK